MSPLWGSSSGRVLAPVGHAHPAQTVLLARLGGEVAGSASLASIPRRVERMQRHSSVIVLVVMVIAFLA
jgi:hypothetical protein